jgi:hypothetical protein
MAKFDLTRLDDVIVGRVEPHIYAFSTNTIPNYLKVGDTDRPVAVRLNEWRLLFPELKKEFEKTAMVSKEVYFRDYSVHSFLEGEMHKKRLQQFELKKGIYYSKEFFFDTKPEDVEKALSDIVNDYLANTGKYQFYTAERLPKKFEYSSTGHWAVRSNQQTVIENFAEAIKKGRTNLLMYAVMRFGKTFTAMCCANQMQAKVVLVVSAKADVKEEWKKTIESADNFSNFVFLDSNDLLISETAIEDVLSGGKDAVIFLTLQDLQGSKIKEKHKELFESKIDLLIVDETHFGARAEKYGEILRNIPKDLKDSREEDSVDTQTADFEVKKLHARIKLHLSGTPYRILMSDEFSKDDIISFVQFSDIVKAQQDWEKDNISKDEPKEEWENPYFGFPQMVRFAFHPNKTSRDRLAELKKNGTTYAFSELFRPLSLKKDEIGNHKKFKYQNEILELLKVIDGSEDDDELLGFLNYKKIKDGNMCHHIVCVLPYRASCDALETLLDVHHSDFINLKEYKIINISGVDNPDLYKDVESVKRDIAECDASGIKTITLTVNRMLTGSTVPEWDTMLYFKDTSSPQEYDQAIFRIQNQFVKSFRSSDGKTILKQNEKPQTLLVDFDPNRVFLMQETKSLIFNINVDKNGNSKLKQRIDDELKISPIFVINKNKLRETEAADIMDFVGNYSKNKGVMDESNELPVDLSLLQIEAVKKVIEKQAEMGSNKGLFIPETNDDGDDIDSGNPPKKGEQGDNHEGKEADNSEDENYRNAAKFKTYYARILFYSFLTKNEVKSLEDILNTISSEDNTRIAKHLGIDSVVLQAFVKYMDPFILSQLDYKVQNLNHLSNDSAINETERAENAIKKFDKLSVSEVVTPQKICNEMVGMISDGELLKIVQSGGIILDLASKRGEFAFSLFNRLLPLDLTKEQIKNCIYSIPTSPTAYEFTRKIYETLGLNVHNIASLFNSYDLLKVRNEAGIDGAKVLQFLIQDKPFDEIELKDDLFTKGDKKGMKFEAIVGNPPYQEKDGGAGASASPLYSDFVDLSRGMNPSYISLIIPTRWYVGGKGLDPFRSSMVNDVRFKELHDFLTPDEIFPNTNNRGGVCYFLWDKTFNNGKNGIEVITHKDGKIIADVVRPFKMFEDEEIFVRDFSGKTIVEKVRAKNLAAFSEIVSSRKPFGLDGNFAKGMKVSKEKTAARPIKCFVKGQKTVFTSLLDVKANPEWVSRWKVFIPRANNIGTELNDDNMNSFVAGPNTICTESYLSVGGSLSLSEQEAKNLATYLQTKFLRYLHGLLKISQDATSKTFEYVPQIDLTGQTIDWSKSIDDIDKQLYSFFGLTSQETKHIEETIKKMAD